MSCNGQWVTGSITGLDESMCFVLPMPIDMALRSAIRGALYELTQPKAWDALGTLSPTECASFFASYWTQYVLTPTNCTGGNSVTMPIGSIIAYGGSLPPNSWLLCNGQELDVTEYPLLFDVIGYTYGGSDDYFNVPDMRGRVPMGAGQGENPSLTLRLHGERVGTETHTLTVNEMPAHTHTLQNKSSAGSLGATVATGASNLIATRVTGSTGGNLAHNNIQPSLVVGYIIKATE